MFGREEHVPARQKAEVARRIAMAARQHGIDVTNFVKKYCGAEHSETPDYSNGWIEIFRAGDYTKLGKRKVTPEHLQRVVANYDPAYHEAPVCIGHPATDAPAYAWIGELALDGDMLLAKETQVDPMFAEMRAAGKFKKRSAAFYQDANGDPVGLRHVGWLGAQPPVVKGLKNLSFADEGRSFTEFEEENTMATDTEKTIREQIAAFFAEHFGRKPGESASFSESDVKRIAAEAVTAATGPLQTKVTEMEASLALQKTQFAERERKLAGGETKQRVTDAIAQLKGSGRWIPAFDKMGLPLVFAELAESGKSLEFGEGDAKKQVSPLDLAVSFFEGLSKIVPAGTTYDGRRAAVGGGSPTEDPLTAATRARMKQDKELSFAEAMLREAEEHPELVNAGAATAGSV